MHFNHFEIKLLNLLSFVMHSEWLASYHLIQRWSLISFVRSNHWILHSLPWTSQFQESYITWIEFNKNWKWKMQRALQNIEPIEKIMKKKTVKRFQRFSREAMTVVNILNLITRDLESTQRVIKLRKSRARLKGQMVAMNEVIIISQCRELC